MDENSHSFNTYAANERIKLRQITPSFDARKKGAIIWHEHVNNKNNNNIDDSSTMMKEEAPNNRELAAFFESSVYTSYLDHEKNEKGRCEAYFEYWCPKTFDTENSGKRIETSCTFLFSLYRI